MKYKFKYEMHLHTSESSACAVNTGAEMVRAHREAGYSGLYVTDHAWGGNTAVDIHLPYKEWVKEFSKGYYNALKEGEKQEIDVFFGWEAGFLGTEFLIYGLTPDWLLSNPKIWDATIAEQYKMVHEAGGIVSHAHPYRVEPYIPEVRLMPEYVDAVEVANATHSSRMSVSHNNPEWDDMAREYAKKNNKAFTAGSDVHSVKVLGGGVLFDKRISSSDELCRRIIERDDYILCDGEKYFDLSGNMVTPS